MIDVKLNGVIRDVASQWNDLSLEAARCFANCVLDGLEKENLKLQLLVCYFPELKKILKKLEQVQRKGDHEQYWEKTEELEIELEKLFNFLYKEIKLNDKKIDVIDSKLTVQLIPSIAGFIGPENFSKLEIWEFSLAEMAFTDYFSNGDKDSLDKLIATLYRPKKSFLFLKKNRPDYNGDPRQQFNDQLIASRVRSLSSEACRRESKGDVDKYLISLWFEGWLKQLPELFPKLYEQKKSSGGEAGSWSDTILLVARNEHHEADQVARRNLFQFLRERELQIIEREQTELEIERMRSKNK